MIEETFRVEHPAGLHARPAAEFVQTAARFTARIQVGNASRATGRLVDATSIIGLMTLGVKSGELIVVRADGPEAAAAVSALRRVVAAPATTEPDGPG